MQSNDGGRLPSPTNWKENIAYLYSYHEGSISERNEEIKKMGDVLLERRDISAAIVCFILSQNIDKVLEIWKSRAIYHIQRKEMTREVALADLLQKFMLTKLALDASGNKQAGGSVEANEHFNQVLAEVGNYLTSDEKAATLYVKYLCMNRSTIGEVAALKERLYHANEPLMYGILNPPQLPFEVERIRVINTKGNN